MSTKIRIDKEMMNPEELGLSLFCTVDDRSGSKDRLVTFDIEYRPFDELESQHISVTFKPTFIKSTKEYALTYNKEKYLISDSALNYMTSDYNDIYRHCLNPLHVEYIHDFLEEYLRDKKFTYCDFA